jgi:hypothetical protein|mmetsp:Transcript_43163/g.127888  ORF Transcript_43163/g.127888 Transcript_43163/m.127888 type:complete len:342 (-) Transcript_43163:163-1188(-)
MPKEGHGKELALSQNHTAVVSRNSGLHCDSGTFGGDTRFKYGLIGRGAHSPGGDKFYSRNSIEKLKIEEGRMCTQGVGPRKDMVFGASKNVGPGSYEIVHSAAGRRSPLDGKEYCTANIHQKLPSKLVPADMCSPGPHAKYEVRKNADHHLPSYGVQYMDRAKRHEYQANKDAEGPGPGAYAQDYYSLTKSSSSPALKSKKGQDDDTKAKQTVKSTFGLSDRFRAGKQTCSPQGDMYYAHNKIMSKEDYIAACRACTFGHGQKTNFANPYKGHVTQVSPVTYKPVTSSASRTSAFDGLTERNAAPGSAVIKEMLNLKKSLKEQRNKSLYSYSSAPTSPAAT